MIKALAVMVICLLPIGIVSSCTRVLQEAPVSKPNSVMSLTSVPDSLSSLAVGQQVSLTVDIPSLANSATLYIQKYDGENGAEPGKTQIASSSIVGGRAQFSITLNDSPGSDQRGNPLKLSSGEKFYFLVEAGLSGQGFPASLK